MTHPDLDALLALEHEVRPLDDARSAFYFANRELIETWAALRTDASAQLAERLLELADALESDLAELGESNVLVEGVRSGNHGRVQAARESWVAAGSEVRVGIEWEARPINAKGDVRVYACVRLPSTPRRPKQDVDALTDSLRAMMTGWTSTRPQWPLWRYVKPTSVSLHDIVNEARRDFLRLWAATSASVDAWAQDEDVAVGAEGGTATGIAARTPMTDDDEQAGLDR